jgi:ribonuclease HI
MQKFYVVWVGRQTGVFTNWPAAHRAVDKYPGARFKSFPTRQAAEQAFTSGSDAVVRRRQHENDAKAHSAYLFDVSIYCDGACEPNPGNAGSGIVVYRGGILAELWFGLYNPTGTNNTAELSALSHALRMAEGEIRAGNTVEVCSDSAYSINCVQSWASGWEKRGWRKSGGEIKNLELIQDCYATYQRIAAELSLTHVAGHAGNEGNELADRMAMIAAQRKETALRRYEDPIHVATLLKMRPG